MIQIITIFTQKNLKFLSHRKTSVISQKTAVFFANVKTVNFQIKEEEKTRILGELFTGNKKGQFSLVKK